MSRTAKNVTLAITVLVITAGALESFLRLSGLNLPIPRATDFVFQPQASYVFRPGPRLSATSPDHKIMTDTINEDGLRTAYSKLPKKPWTKRIVALGDSFTAGMQVPPASTYSAVAEKILLSQVGVTEVINAGVDGYSLKNEMRLLRSVGITYHPDLVVLGLYVGNDLHPYKAWEMTHDPSDLRWAVRAWLDGLILLRYPIYLLNRYLISGESATGSVDISAQSRMLSVLRKLGGDVRDESHIESYLGNLRAEVETFQKDANDGPIFDQTARILTVMDKFLRTRKVRFAVVLIPTKRQVEPEAWKDAVFILTVDPAVHDLERPQRNLLRRLRGHITVLDLLPTFLNQKERENPLYWPIDGHWNAAGHRLAGQAIGRFILSNSLLAPPD